MYRRDFLRSLACTAPALAACLPGLRVHAAPDDYTGRFLVTLQLKGGWDPTSLCDPKVNQPGEQIINHWASSGEIQTAGNLHFAPVASNQRLFSQHASKMLVVNGVDTQTNSHSTGRLHTWSGINTIGQPTMTALFAAAVAPDLPLAYVSNGSVSETEGLIRRNRLDRQDALEPLLDPNIHREKDSRVLRRSADVSRVQAYQQAALQRKLSRVDLTPLQRQNVAAHLEAIQGRDLLLDFLARLPNEDETQAPIQLPVANVRSRLLPQIQLAMLAFQSGVSVACDLGLGGFDTHSNHDARVTALYDHLADAIDYFWSYADQLGIASRVTLVIGSDFGRRPSYNSGNGKDHWPIGSYILMESAPTWGNRTVGLTDDGHGAYKIHPDTLARDDTNGIILQPKHVHQAIRRYLGIEDFVQQQSLALPATENVDIFNPSFSTI